MRIVKTFKRGIPVFAVEMDPMDTLNHLVRIKQALRDEADLTRPTVLDLAAVDFLNSSTMGSIVGASRLFHEHGGYLLLAGLGPRLAETFRIVRLDKVLAYRMTVDEAVEEILKATGSKYPELVKANPSVEDVKSSWRMPAVPVADPEETPTKPSQLRQMALGDDAPIPPAVQRYMDELTPVSDVVNNQAYLREWNEALILFRKAQEMAGRHNVPFTADMTFKEFLAAMSNVLAR